MKFGQTLSTRLTPEWRKQYIHYFRLKKMILNAAENLPSPNSRTYFAYLDDFDEEFFSFLNKEYFKVDAFFSEKLAEAKRKYREFLSEIEILAEGDPDGRVSEMDLSKVLSKQKLKEMQLAVSEYYLSLMLLRNFQTLNLTGFRKILKKHDKKLNLNNGAKWYAREIEGSQLALNTEVEEIIKKVEDLYTNNMAGGDRASAMKHLRIPPFEELQSPWRIFRLGFALGIFTCLLCFIVFCILTFRIPSKNCAVCISMHRGPFLIILLIFLIGLNVYGWQKAGVNHILIFEINPRNHLTATHVLEIATHFGVLCAFSFLGCLFRGSNLIPPNAYALILVILMLFYWFMPVAFHWQARLWLMKIMGRIVLAPFFQVKFADFWLADQISSLASALIDHQFIACACVTKNWFNTPEPYSCLNEVKYITTAVLFALPAWWRFAQCLRRFWDTRLCFPFLANAGKYATAFPVAGLQAVLMKNKSYTHVTENPYYWFFIASRLVQTIYSYTWDVLMDFGLFTKFSGTNIFLRDEIIYAPSFYYFAIIENFVLRFLWVGSLLIKTMDPIMQIYLATLLAVGEVVRRYLWNYFRLEHEHVNNAGQFRAVRDISVKLITMEEEKSIEPRKDRRDGIYYIGKLQSEDEL